MITLSQIKGAVMWHLVYYDMSRGTTCTNTEHAQISASVRVTPGGVHRIFLCAVGK